MSYILAVSFEVLHAKTHTEPMQLHQTFSQDARNWGGKNGFVYISLLFTHVKHATTDDMRQQIVVRFFTVSTVLGI
jgi:hypothetical protein